MKSNLPGSARTVSLDWTEPDFRAGLQLLLSEIMHGEILSMETSAAMAGFAPSLAAKFFLVEQAGDERRHALAFQKHLQDLGLAPLPRSVSMEEVAAYFSSCVEAKDWLRCLVAQNIVLEGVATVLFEALEQIADPETTRLLAGVNLDEKKHVSFGVTSLLKLRDTPNFRNTVLKTYEPLLQMMARMFTLQRRIKEDHGIDYRAVADAALSNLTDRLKTLGVELSVWQKTKFLIWQWLR